MGQHTADGAPTAAPLAPSGGAPTGEPSADEVRAELGRVAAARGLRGSDRLRRFLRLVVEETLAGRGETLKEYRLGLEVFERPESFDPKTDPVVRVEARRLRAKIADYYQTEGAGDEVAIALPKGAYVAAFSRRSNAPPSAQAAPGIAALAAVPTASPDADGGSLEPAGLPSVRSRRRGRAWWMAIPALVALASAAWWALDRGRRTEAVVTIAVLPFANASSDPENEYSSFGLMEDLTTCLARMRGLRVISRTSASAFTGGQDVRDIGRRLHADYLVEGSLRKDGDRLRATAQLVAAADGAHLWANAWDLSERDLPAVPVEMANAIAAALGSGVAPLPAGPQPGATDPVAHVLYVKGRYFLGTVGSQAPEKAAGYLRQAIARAPEFAAAHAALAAAHAKITLDRPAPLAAEVELARDEARQALRLDPSMAEAHGLLAWIAFFYDWNSQEAEAGFKRALAINANAAGTLHRYSLMLAARRRFAEALDQSAQAAALDPLSALVLSNRAMILLCARRYDEAIAQGRAALELAPAAYPTHVLIGSSYAQQGRFGDAIAAYRAALALAPDDGDAACSLARALALSGARAEAVRMLADLRRPDRASPPSRYELAYVLAALDDRDAAFAALDDARVRHETELVYLDIDPLFDGLRSDPRFEPFVRRLGVRR